MAQVLHLTPYDDLVQALVAEIEAAGLPLDLAIWTREDEERWRLFLLVSAGAAVSFEEAVRQVVNAKRTMYDRFPNVLDITTKIVHPDDPVVKALAHYRHITPKAPKYVPPFWNHGTYIDESLILKAA